MKKFICVFLLFFISQIAMADTTTPPITIKSVGIGWGLAELYIESNENVIVEDCASARLKVSLTNPMFDHILSIALSAYHTNSKVTLRVKGCDGSDMNAVSIRVSEDV
ncbi:hypothetical protein MJO52_09565 [Microbulbifer variabilis]|uniref:Uncharacterized protein n=1 Tax=Microbulbifer variabilis TaxID=266805 RepID=A0ABY4VND4_9GAMM|nr:hypothetical protein [Microbulbifer variabilis]USD23364.1 hypothetical protein MJO52_09565 [Microbulbifer variabilis]